MSYAKRRHGWRKVLSDNRLRCWLVALAGVVVPAVPAGAQMTIDAAFRSEFRSQYLDRGVFLANTPVLRPAVEFGIGIGGGQIGLGVDATMQLVARGGDSLQLLMAPGQEFYLPAEVAPTIRFSQPFGRGGGVVVDIVAAYRLFTATDTAGPGLGRSASIGRVGTRLRFPVSALRPEVSFSYEAGAVQGGYAEVRLTPHAAIAQGASVGVLLVGGLATGQTVPPDAPVRYGPFARTGATHAEVAPYAEAVIAGVRFRPYLSLQYALFPAQPALFDGTQRLGARFVTVFGTTLSLEGSFGGAKPAAPAR